MTEPQSVEQATRVVDVPVSDETLLTPTEQEQFEALEAQIFTNEPETQGPDWQVERERLDEEAEEIIDGYRFILAAQVSPPEGITDTDLSLIKKAISNAHRQYVFGQEKVRDEKTGEPILDREGNETLFFVADLDSSDPRYMTQEAVLARADKFQTAVGLETKAFYEAHPEERAMQNASMALAETPEVPVIDPDQTVDDIEGQRARAVGNHPDGTVMNPIMTDEPTAEYRMQ